MAGFPVIGSGKFIASDILLLMQGVQVLNHSERSEGLGPVVLSECEGTGPVILSECEGSGFKTLRTNRILRADETSPQDDRGKGRIRFFVALLLRMTIISLAPQNDSV